MGAAADGGRLVKETIQVMGVTTVIFAAGLLSGAWLQHPRMHGRPDFGHMQGRPFSQGESPEVLDKVRRAEPEMTAYRQKVDAIRLQCRQGIAALLNDGQKARFTQLQAEFDAESEHHRPPEGVFRKVLDAGGPITGPLQGDGNFLSLIVYRPYLDLLTGELGLTPPQQASVEALLVTRRKALLALVDQETPPNLLLIPTLLEHEPPHGAPGQPSGPPH